MELYVM